jgi:hypothetical protein
VNDHYTVPAYDASIVGGDAAEAFLSDAADGFPRRVFCLRDDWVVWGGPSESPNYSTSGILTGMNVFTASEMRECDRRAIESTASPRLPDGVGGDRARERVRGRTGRRRSREDITILCGTGKHGGDGFVAARIWTSPGCELRVPFWRHADQLQRRCATHFARCKNSWL